MSLRAFAENNRLKVRRDEDNTRIIPGKHGHIWDHGDDLFGVTLLDLTPRKWTHRKKLCLEAGMELQQDGDFEGTLLFDPTDVDQVRVALRVAGVKKRRTMSPAQLEVLARARKASPIMRRGLSSDFSPQEQEGRVFDGGSDSSTVSFSEREGSEAA